MGQEIEELQTALRQFAQEIGAGRSRKLRSGNPASSSVSVYRRRLPGLIDPHGKAAIDPTPTGKLKNLGARTVPALDTGVLGALSMTLAGDSGL